MPARIKQGLAKVVFQDRVFRNGKNFIWIRLSRAYFERIANYWRSQQGFYYMKVYYFDRKNRIVGPQMGYITRDKIDHD